MSRKERTYHVTCIAIGYDSLSRVPVRLNLAQSSQQWQVVQERIAKSKKSSQEPTKVGGKRKASGSGAKGSGRSSKPKLGASGKLSDEQFQKDMAEKLCHICHQPNHIARNRPQNKKSKKGKGGKVAAASGARPEDEMSDGDF
jgi:hypothetical protein